MNAMVVLEKTRPIAEFRPMTVRDIPEVVAVEWSWEGSRWTRAMFERELGLPFSLSAVAEIGGIPVGFGVLWTVTDLAQLLEFAVSAPYRRQGIGAGLLNYMARSAKDRGCVKMELELHEGNFPAQRFYEKMGFLTSGRRRRFYDLGRGVLCDAILMDRPL